MGLIGTFLSLRGLLLVVLSIASLFVDLFLFNYGSHAVAPQEVPFGTHDFLYSTSDVHPTYSWNGTDFPTFLLLDTKYVKMVAEESTRFSITDIEAADEWLWTAPVGDNHVRLGPEHRMFALAMFHQLHCLRGIREHMEKGAPGTDEHIHHCFNYVRQWILCDADTTLEKGDFTQRNFSSHRAGGDYICRDWIPVYNFVRNNWVDWKKYQEEHGLEDIVE